MGDMAGEPSMEEILSSIKKIIAEDDAKAVPQGTRIRAERTGPVPDPIGVSDPDSVLELTQNVPDEGAVAEPILSPVAEAASRQALANLSRLIVKPEVSGSDTLEGLVREMLKPMLKDWLDAHLPEIVERVVAQEVARLTGQSQS